jgi:DNA polymerase I-like protein with 3'-5' exonuclease and polymerase domains
LQTNYLIHDCETTTKKSFKRTANPFDPDNFVVANGFKRPGEDTFCDYHTEPGQQRIPIEDRDKILVGFNYKFDLLWHWQLKNLMEFFKRGGRIWCCQYAEYLLEGQDVHAQMCAMDDIVEKYGGKLKIDEVKAMWKAGIDTVDIPKDLLLLYLGGEDGDISNTEKIYLAQVKRAIEQDQYADIMQRMDGLLATTMMEYNGLFINQKQAYEDRDMLIRELKVIDNTLAACLPPMPPGLDFNWGSGTHKSCLIFGGTIKYKRWAASLDAEGKQLYAQRKVSYCLDNGVPCMTEFAFKCSQRTTPEGFVVSPYKVDRIASGKKKGEIKTKQVTLPDLSKPKGCQTEFGYTLPGITSPDPEWKGKKVDVNGKPIYSTGKDVIEELGNRGIPFLSAMANRSKLTKDIGTYYVTEDANGIKTGMLTCVDERSVIHHKINHSLTITSRLSSSDPNLQNLTRADFDELLGRPKSVVKRMFSSRFGEDGEMTEADYKQLEVVVQGLLTGDKQLILDLQAGIDFHCKRLSAKEDMPYEQIVDLCKVQKLPEWTVKRTKTKEFTFQRAFGAALRSIAAKTGMSLEDVEKLSEAEEKLYPGIRLFYDLVEASAAGSRVPTSRQEPYPDKPEVWTSVGKGFYKTVTQALFVFYEKPSPKFLRSRGVMTSLYRPHIQNYPIQGTAAQIVQYILGLLFRHYIRNDNYNGKAFLVNTVHDCVWSDHHKSVREEVRSDIKRIMQLVPALLQKIHGVTTELEFPVSVETGPNMMDLN